MCATHSCLNRKKSQQSKFWGLFLSEVLICELGKADHRPPAERKRWQQIRPTGSWHQPSNTALAPRKGNWKKKLFGFLLIWRSPNQSTCSRQTVAAATHDNRFLFCLGLCYLKSTNEWHGEIQTGQQPTPVCFSPVTNLPQIPAGWDRTHHRAEETDVRSSCFPRAGVAERESQNQELETPNYGILPRHCQRERGFLLGGELERKSRKERDSLR